MTRLNHDRFTSYAACNVPVNVPLGSRLVIVIVTKEALRLANTARSEVARANISARSASDALPLSNWRILARCVEFWRQSSETTEVLTSPDPKFRRVRSDDLNQRYRAAGELASHPATSARAGLRQRLHTGSPRTAVHSPFQARSLHRCPASARLRQGCCVRAPTIGAMTPGRSATQLNATWAGVAAISLATRTTASIVAQLQSELAYSSEIH
jgi:hypothetical protein